MQGYDDGSGPQLLVGGDFQLAGETHAVNLARWDARRSPVLGHVVWRGLGDALFRMVLDVGDGPAIYASGEFIAAGNRLVHGIARWDGWTWGALGDEDLHVEVTDFAAFDDGFGLALYMRPEAALSGSKWDADF